MMSFHHHSVGLRLGMVSRAFVAHRPATLRANSLKHLNSFNFPFTFEISILGGSHRLWQNEAVIASLSPCDVQQTGRILSIFLTAFRNLISSTASSDLIFLAVPLKLIALHLVDVCRIGFNVH
jgi:hypothetical protein